MKKLIQTTAALLVLGAASASAEESMKQFKVWAVDFSDGGLEAAVGEGAAQILGDVGADVDSHLVDQSQRTHGVAEVLQNAIKIDYWDVDAMADATFALLHYQGISKMFKELGSEELKNLKWEHVAARLVKIYEKTLAQ